MTNQKPLTMQNLIDTWEWMKRNDGPSHETEKLKMKIGDKKLPVTNDAAVIELCDALGLDAGMVTRIYVDILPGQKAFEIHIQMLPTEYQLDELSKIIADSPKKLIYDNHNA